MRSLHILHAYADADADADADAYQQEFDDVRNCIRTSREQS
jgi:hypothetical protein